MKRETTHKPDREAKKAVRRLVSAVDRIIEAARQAEEARDQLLGSNSEGKRDE